MRRKTRETRALRRDASRGYADDRDPGRYVFSYDGTGSNRRTGPYDDAGQENGARPDLRTRFDDGIAGKMYAGVDGNEVR